MSARLRNIFAGVSAFSAVIGAVPAFGAIVNISATANGEQTGGANCNIACAGPLINPVQVTFDAGTYVFSDAYSPVTGLAPGALYSAWNFQSGNPFAWAWHWKALLDDGAAGATINPTNYDSFILLDIDRRNPEDVRATQAEAALLGFQTPASMLTFTQTTTVNFVVNDFFLSDNAGGVSLSVNKLGVVTPSVPEPATWGLMLVGFGTIGTSMRRLRQRTAHAA